MADAKIVNTGENTPEKIALDLFHYVAALENRALYSHGTSPADRKYILDTYAECLLVVRVPQNRKGVV